MIESWTGLVILTVHTVPKTNTNLCKIKPSRCNGICPAFVYIWPKSRTYTVASAPAWTGSFICPEIHFLGQCVLSLHTSKQLDYKDWSPPLYDMLYYRYYGEHVHLAKVQRWTLFFRANTICDFYKCPRSFELPYFLRPQKGSKLFGNRWSKNFGLCGHSY